MARPPETEPPEPFEPWDVDDAWDGPEGRGALGDEPEDAPGVRHAGTGRRSISLQGLSVAGITRRRTAVLLGAVVALWIVIVFARQVGDAAAATARADRIRADNAALATEVASLQAELRLVQGPEYIAQQARGYGLGTPQERPFALAPGAPPLASGAPGSAALRLGAVAAARSPLETWLSLLFGPSPR